MLRHAGADADERREAEPGTEIDIGVGHHDDSRVIAVILVEAAAARTEFGVAAEGIELRLGAILGRRIEAQPGIPLIADAAADEECVARVLLVDAPARRPNEAR